MQSRTKPLLILLLLLLMPMLLATFCSAGRSREQPKLFSLLMPGNAKPKEFRVYFSTMSEFVRKKATQLLYFLRVADKEFDHQFVPSEVSCIANSSYCYVSGSLPQLEPNWCDFGVVLRIATINNDFCDPGDCLNIYSPIECAMRVQQDRKECQERNWPFEACNYPPFVETVARPKLNNLSPNSTCVHSRPVVTVETVMLIGLSLFAFLTIVFSVFVYVRVHRFRPKTRLIVLVPIERGQSLYGICLPTNEEVEKVRSLPAYSFIATVVPFKKPL